MLWWPRSSINEGCPVSLGGVTLRLLWVMLFLLGVGIAQASNADKTLIVGSEQDYPPFALGKTDETAGGFTVDLWKAVAAESGITYSIRVRPFRQILQEFKEGKIDILINLAQSEERRQFADFTVPHVVVNGALFVRTGESRINSEDDLADKSIIVLSADLAHDYAIARGWKNQLVLVDTAADGLNLLSSGKHDVMLLGKIAGIQTLDEQKIGNIRPLKIKAGFSQRFSFAVHKGDSDLLARINEGLSLTKPSGVYDALYEKWLGVYEDKEISRRDLLKVLIVAILLFLCISAYQYHRRQMERNLLAENVSEREIKYRLLFETAHDGVFLMNETGFVDCNQRGADMYGRTKDDIIGHSPLEFAPELQPDGRASAEAAGATIQAAMRGDPQIFTWQSKRVDGVLFDVEITLNRIQIGTSVSLQAIVRDVTERKKAEEELKRLARTDILTGLANRGHFMDMAEQELSRTHRYGGPLSVFMMDIDHFKNINDTYGHQVGDIVLQRLGGICREALRDIDSVGRVGGEEFAVLLPQTDGLRALEVAERLRQTVARSQIVLERGLPIHFAVSIGITTLVGNDANIDILLGQADKALYQAKHAGRNRVYVYEGLL